MFRKRDDRYVSLKPASVGLAECLDACLDAWIAHVQTDGLTDHEWTDWRMDEWAAESFVTKHSRTRGIIERESD